MNHLSRAELVLFQSGIGLSVSQKKKVADHLRMCHHCRMKLSEIQNDAPKISENNLQECQQFQNSLPAYLDGELDHLTALALTEHLGQCDRCQRLYQLATDLPAWEDVATAEVEIPMRIKEKIEHAVFQAVRKDFIEATIKQSSKKIASAIEGMVANFILSFRPIQPGAVFRGNGSDELKVIEHPGGNLHLATGLKHVTLELTSIFEDFILNGQTDENGEIVFENLAKGEYIASVSGYRLTEVKVRS